MLELEQQFFCASMALIKTCRARSAPCCAGCHKNCRRRCRRCGLQDQILLFSRWRLRFGQQRDGDWRAGVFTTICAHRSRDKAVRQKHSFAATQNTIPASCNAMSAATEVLSNSIAIRGKVRRSGVMSPSLAARHRSRPMGTR